MADVQCPMIKQRRPMSDCITCGNHIKEGTSLEWCGYRAPEPPKALGTEIPVTAMEMQIRQKLSKAEYFYRVGKTRIAEKLSNEAVHLEINIRRLKRDERKNA